MADIPFPTNLLPTYQTPQAMAASAASTANMQAGTQLLGAQTTSANIANQSNQLSLSALQQAYAGGAPTAPSPASSSAVGDTGIVADDVTQHAIDKFAPIPTAPPPALRQQAYLLSLGGKPDAAKGLLDNYATQVQGANQQRQLAANNSYQTAETVASAPAGAAWDVLSRVNPQAADALKTKYVDATPAELDQDVRTFAQHIGIATHQYTGRDTDFQNGVLVDKKDGKPVLGSEQVLTGLDAAGKEKAFASANEPVTIGNNLPVPRWQQAGFSNAESYVIAADKAARSSAAKADTAASGNAQGPATKLSAPVSAQAAVLADPMLKTALSDTSYRWQQPFPKPTTQEQQSANVDAQKANVAAGQTLKSQSDQAVSAAASAQTYLQAAKAIIDSKGAAVGAYGGLIAKASSFVGDYKGDASNYQELSKYLNNAAIAAAKGNYGSGLTEKELELQLTGASPSVDKTPGALKSLVEENLRNTKYTLDTANRVVPYLKAGNDPTNFNKWNQGTWNQSAAVNKPQSAAATVPTAGTIRGGYKFLGGDPANKSSWAKQ